jgi:hypothetical protein
MSFVNRAMGMVSAHARGLGAMTGEPSIDEIVRAIPAPAGQRWQQVEHLPVTEMPSNPAGSGGAARQVGVRGHTYSYLTRVSSTDHFNHRDRGWLVLFGANAAGMQAHPDKSAAVAAITHAQNVMNKAKSQCEAVTGPGYTGALKFEATLRGEFTAAVGEAINAIHAINPNAQTGTASGAVSLVLYQISALESDAPRAAAMCVEDRKGRSDPLKSVASAIWSLIPGGGVLLASQLEWITNHPSYLVCSTEAMTALLLLGGVSKRIFDAAQTAINELNAALNAPLQISYWSYTFQPVSATAQFHPPSMGPTTTPQMSPQAPAQAPSQFAPAPAAAAFAPAAPAVRPLLTRATARLFR